MTDEELFMRNGMHYNLILAHNFADRAERTGGTLDGIKELLSEAADFAEAGKFNKAMDLVRDVEGELDKLVNGAHYAKATISSLFKTIKEAADD